jgi:hypothetical protein
MNCSRRDRAVQKAYLNPTLHFDAFLRFKSEFRKE